MIRSAIYFVLIGIWHWVSHAINVRSDLSSMLVLQFTVGKISTGIAIFNALDLHCVELIEFDKSTFDLHHST